MPVRPPTPPRPAVPARRQPPATPLPDFRHVFLEPVYSEPFTHDADLAEADDPGGADAPR